MRKVTNNAVNAFLAGRNFSEGNTTVCDYNSYTVLLLHGNKIAELEYSGAGKDFKRTLLIRNCGWFSNTTKERLNALPGVSISQKKGIWYLNGKEWNGETERILLD